MKYYVINFLDGTQKRACFESYFDAVIFAESLTVLYDPDYLIDVYDSKEEYDENVRVSCFNEKEV